MVAKVDEMRSQRSLLVSQLRDAVHADDLTARLLADKHFDAQVCAKAQVTQDTLCM
jgi:hypothetical protein